MHMGKCCKTAIILSEKVAPKLFAIMKAAKLSAFFGTDKLNENLYGYVFFEFFPESLLLNTKLTLSSGILACRVVAEIFQVVFDFESPLGYCGT